MAALIRSLSLIDVVLMTVVSVVSLRWIARGALAGAAAIPLWIAAALLFFVPLAIATSKLASRHPAQGGIYVWARTAFGPSHAFLCGWCLWVNNLFYFPSLLLFGAANALAPFGDRYAHLADDRGYSTAFVLIALWAAVGVNVIGLRLGRWVHNAGSLGIWIPAALVIGAGAFALARWGSATSFAPAALVPRGDTLSVIALWSAMCFAFSGMEITSLVGREVKHAERAIPRGILIAGALVALVYLAGTAAVLVAIPADALRERSGLADAVALVTSRAGLGAFGGLTGAMLALAAVAGTVAWMAGAARVPFAAGADRALPAAFSRLHPRWQTPVFALVTQGVVSSLIFLASVYVSAGGATSVQDAYDILVNLTILIYFVPYLYLFAALPKLTGGSHAWAACGLLATSASLALVFVPPPQADALAYEISLAGQAAAILSVGYALKWLARRPPAAHGRSGS
ncbi:MAG TPA: APC family permease [Vicinamibacterales bacterium]|nr:APC family permease [Vicinamibacterales bacterium]